MIDTTTAIGRVAEHLRQFDRLADTGGRIHSAFTDPETDNGADLNSADVHEVVRLARAATAPTDDQIEAGARAWHDAEHGDGSWDDYGTWTTSTDKVHNTYITRMRIALAAITA